METVVFIYPCLLYFIEYWDEISTCNFQSNALSIYQMGFP